jgi:hypothetical protein
MADTNDDDGKTSDGNTRSHSGADPAVRDEAERIRLELEAIDALPLPPHLADKPLDYFAEIAHRAAQEVIDRLPEGALASPLVRSALNAGRPTPAKECTCGGRIAKTPSTSFSSPKIV